jgi:hypothetical protein
MLLFQKRFHAGLVDGSVTLTFRRWQRPHVRPGGRYRVHPIGVVEVSALSERRLGDVTPRDARAAGFRDVSELRAFLAAPVKVRGAGIVRRDPVDDDTPVWRVALRHAGQDDRVAIALDDDLSKEDVEAIAARLRRLDARAPWTRTTLTLIGRHPRVAASRLARMAGRETPPFKVDVRKLKRLGLTMSFEVGYELSPRGRAFLRHRKRW